MTERRWQIERAGTPLLGALHALAAASFPDPWSENAFAEELREPTAIVLVARGGEGAVAGYLAARRALDELHVLSLGVDPARRRQGAASALLLAALAEAGAAGARLVHLEVREGNRAALAFYGRFGFRAVGRRRRYYPDGEDALLLCARVAAAACAAGDAA